MAENHAGDKIPSIWITFALITVILVAGFLARSLSLLVGADSVVCECRMHLPAVRLAS